MLAGGTHLHDRYRILRAIGRGGMGAVYEAVDTRLRNTVAVKQLALGGRAADRAFEREAQLLASLRHAVLPVVIDYFSDANDRFLVMQYIEGEDFAHYVERRGGPCPPDEVVSVARTVLDALEYLHAQAPPIVHRDIKPANLKRTPTGDVVLLDFGLAKGRLDHDPTVAADDRSLYGFTLTYAPPEQIDGRPTDARSDLFALGATLYHLAVGVPPPSALERTMAVRNGDPDPLVAADIANPAVSAVVGRAISRALQLDPAHRFASAAEMRSALSSIDTPPVVAEPKTSDRRVDAALPSHVGVGRQTDLLVQVRFADSPLLGLEDWPTARRPEHVEQQSEPLQVTHLVDHASGRLMPARVRIKVVASDFAIEGDAERLIEVPVNDYSRRIAFLMTPRRAGYCRANVEVYALDSLYLGTVAVEAQAVAEGAPEPAQTVAHMVLGTFARKMMDATTVVPEVSASAETVRQRVSPPDATLAVLTPDPELARAETDLVAEAQRQQARQEAAARVRVEAERRLREREAARHVATEPPADAAPVFAAPTIVQPAAASPPTMMAPAPPPVAAKAQPPRDATPPAAAAPPTPTPTARARVEATPDQRSFGSRVSVWGSAVAAVLIVGIVYLTRPQFSPSAPTGSSPTLAPPPVAATAPPAEAPKGQATTAAAKPRPPRDPVPPSSASSNTAKGNVPPAAEPIAASNPPPAPAMLPPSGAATSAAPRPAVNAESPDELLDALRRAEAARQANPSSEEAAAAVAQMRARVKKAGYDAFIKASQFDRADQAADAVRAYEVAIKLLPDDDPYTRVAKQRVDALRAKK